MAWWNRESAQQSGEALNTKAARMSPRFSYDALAKRLDAMPLSDALRASLKTSAQNIQGILNELIIRKSRKAVMADRWPDGFGYGETTFDRLAFMRAGSNDTDNPEIKKFNTPVAIPEHPSEFIAFLENLSKEREDFTKKFPEFLERLAYAQSLDDIRAAHLTVRPGAGVGEEAKEWLHKTSDAHALLIAKKEIAALSDSRSLKDFWQKLNTPEALPIFLPETKTALENSFIRHAADHYTRIASALTAPSDAYFCQLELTQVFEGTLTESIMKMLDSTYDAFEPLVFQYFTDRIHDYASDLDSLLGIRADLQTTFMRSSDRISFTNQIDSHVSQAIETKITGLTDPSAFVDLINDLSTFSLQAAEIDNFTQRIMKRASEVLETSKPQAVFDVESWIRLIEYSPHSFHDNVVSRLESQIVSHFTSRIYAANTLEQLLNIHTEFEDTHHTQAIDTRILSVYDRQCLKVLKLRILHEYGVDVLADMLNKLDELFPLPSDKAREAYRTLHSAAEGNIATAFGQRILSAPTRAALHAIEAQASSWFSTLPAHLARSIDSAIASRSRALS